MTGEELIDALRFLLHDQARQSDTGAQFYSDEVLSVALTDALAQILKEMILEKPRRSPVAVSRLSKTVAIAAVPQSVPDDFWMLECGTKMVSGVETYVPAIRADLGEQYSGLRTYGKIYVRGGAFYGPADKAVYFVQPPKITKSVKQLPYFTDTLYNAAKMLAATNSIIQESRGAVARWTFFQNDFAMVRQILS